MPAERFSRHLSLVTAPMPHDLARLTDVGAGTRPSGWPGRPGNQAERQHGARYPPNATGVSHTRTASVSPPAAATAGERLSCTQRANTSTVTPSAPPGAISSPFLPSTPLLTPAAPPS